jgi:hypothetical protein
VIKRLLRLAMLAAIVGAITSVVKALREGPSPEPARAGAPGGATPDEWPEVPRNPEA